MVLPIVAFVTHHRLPTSEGRDSANGPPSLSRNTTSGPSSMHRCTTRPVRTCRSSSTGAAASRTWSRLGPREPIREAR